MNDQQIELLNKSKQNAITNQINNIMGQIANVNENSKSGGNSMTQSLNTPFVETTDQDEMKLHQPNAHAIVSEIEKLSCGNSDNLNYDDLYEDTNTGQEETLKKPSEQLKSIDTNNSQARMSKMRGIKSEINALMT